MVDRAEQGGGSQVGVGIGAADAVFDMPGRRRAAGHAQAHGTVVDAPGRCQWRIAVGLEAPVGIGVGTEQQQRIEQRVEHAAHPLAQQWRAGRVGAGEQVVALGVGQAHVQVHAGAGQLGERLGHEAGLHAVLVRHALDDALVAHGLVHGQQGVAVLQGDFHLARGVFGNRRARRNVLGLAGGVEVGEEGFELFQFTQAIDLRASRSPAVGVKCRLRPAVAVAFLVEQVKLQLAGHHRVETIGLERLDHPQQDMARVGVGGGQALLGVHADLHRRGRHLPPRQAHQAAFEGIGAAVDIADVPDQPGVFHVVAVQGQAKDGAGQGPAALVDRQQFLAVQQLAARYAVGVEDEQLDHFDIGIGVQERAGLLDGGKVHGCSRLRRGGALGIDKEADAKARPGLSVRRERYPVGGHGGSATRPRRRGSHGRAGFHHGGPAPSGTKGLAGGGAQRWAKSCPDTPMMAKVH